MKVAAAIPAGRKRYLEILVPYLLKNREHIDECHLWLNTQNEQDRQYILQLASEYPTFFYVEERDFFSKDIAQNVWQYFQSCTDENTVYLRLDDDICYIDKQAIPRIINFRLQNPEPFLVYGNIVNNAICSYIQQQRGVIPRRWGKLQFECLGKAWKSGRFATKLHQKFLQDAIKGDTHLWEYDSRTMQNYERFSINVICWFGKDKCYSR